MVTLINILTDNMNVGYVLVAFLLSFFIGLAFCKWYKILSWITGISSIVMYAIGLILVCVYTKDTSISSMLKGGFFDIINQNGIPSSLEPYTKLLFRYGFWMYKVLIWSFLFCTAFQMKNKVLSIYMFFLSAVYFLFYGAKGLIKVEDVLLYGRYVLLLLFFIGSVLDSEMRRNQAIRFLIIVSLFTCIYSQVVTNMIPNRVFDRWCYLDVVILPILISFVAFYSIKLGGKKHVEAK